MGEIIRERTHAEIADDIAQSAVGIAEAAGLQFRATWAPDKCRENLAAEVMHWLDFWFRDAPKGGEGT